MAHCARDACTRFHTFRHKWEYDKASGKVLYDFAAAEARVPGWELPACGGLCGLMMDVDFTPSPLLRVLEIHIRHPSAGYGAFCEDMLPDDSYVPNFKV
jgi:hypothetical protein